MLYSESDECHMNHETSGTHMNYFIHKELPVLPLEHYTEYDLAFDPTLPDSPVGELENKEMREYGE